MYSFCKFIFTFFPWAFFLIPNSGLAQTQIPYNQINCVSYSATSGNPCVLVNGSGSAFSSTSNWSIVLDMQTERNINQIGFNFYATGTGANITLKTIVSTAPTTLGPWITARIENVSGNTTSQAKMISSIDKVARYVKLEVNNISGTGTPVWNSFMLYEKLLLNINGSAILQDGECVKIAAAAQGESYLWSTGETSREINACNPGKYSVQVTNMSFTGNQDHAASVLVSKLGSAEMLPGPNGEVHALYQKGKFLYIGGDFTTFGTTTRSSALLGSKSAKVAANWPRIVGTVITAIADGKGGWYVGGDFKEIEGYPISNLAHIKSDNTLDVNFMPEPDSTVHALALNGNTLYVGGAFTSIQSLGTSYLAKIDANTGAPEFWNAGINGPVLSLALYNNQIVIAGNFTTLGNSSRSFLGSIDTIYAQATSWNPNPNLGVTKVYVNANKLYIGGDFTSISGVSKSRGAGYSLPSFAIDGYDFGANGRINDFLMNNGVLYVAGNFTIIGGANRNYLAALNPQNGLANSFNPNPDAPVFALALSGGNLIIGGKFTSIAGVSRNLIASFNLSTFLINNWDPKLGSVKYPKETFTFNYKGGVADYFVVPPGVVSIDADVQGAMGGKSSFPSPLKPPGGNGGRVEAQLIAQRGDTFAIFVGGKGENSKSNTQTAGGGVIIGGIGGALGGGGGGSSDIRIKPYDVNKRLIVAGGGGGATETSDPSARGGHGGGLSGEGALGGLAGGGGTQFGGGVGGYGNPQVGAGGLGFGGSGQSSGGAGGGGGYYGGGAGAATITGGSGSGGGGSSYTTLGARNVVHTQGYNGIGDGVVKITVDRTAVLCLAITDTLIYAAGNFHSVGNTFRNNLAAIDITTGLLADWNPNVDSTVRAIYADNNFVYIGGDFSKVQGSIIKNRIAQFNVSTGIATGWNPNADGSVFAITAKNNTVYVGGAFSNIGGASRTGIAGLSIISGAATTFNPQANGPVYALAVGGDTLYMGGSFTTIGAQLRNRVAAFKLSENLLTLINPNADGDVFALSFFQNKLYIGGGFSNVSSQSRVNFAEFDVLGNALTRFNPSISSTGGIRTLFSNDSALYNGGSLQYSNQGQPINNLAAINTSVSEVGYWQPQPDDIVRTIFATADRVYVGGRFINILGRYQPYFASVEPFYFRPKKYYYFIGSGNWSIDDNWLNKSKPPSVLPESDEIIINPSGTNESILNSPLKINSKSKIVIKPGKRLKILGELKVE